MTESAQPGKWRRLLRMKPSQWGVVLLTPWILLLQWRRLRRDGYRQTLELMPQLPPASAGPEQQLRAAEETAFAVRVGLRAGPWRPRCLLRSLVLGWFLSRRGIPYQLRLGVAGGPVDFNAHAWVEHAGVVLNDREDVGASFSAFGGGSGSA